MRQSSLRAGTHQLEEEQAPSDRTRTDPEEETKPLKMRGRPVAEEQALSARGRKEFVEDERKFLTIQNLNDIPDSLSRYSMRASAFHFGQAAILFYFASKSDTQWRWYTNYPEPEDDALSHPPLGPDPEQVAYFSILWYSPVFISMAGLEHLCCLIYKDQYHYYVARNQNPFRWTEYTFSASLMRVMVAQFAGITDVHLLLVTFVLSALTMQLGAAHEVFNAKARSEDRWQNWRCYYLAWLSQGISWMIIFNYFGMRVRSGSQPDFIWVIIIVMFLLDSSFALVFYLQWARIPPFQDYATGERAFIVLSFFAKTLLAWIGFGGVYRRY